MGLWSHLADQLTHLRYVLDLSKKIPTVVRSLDNFYKRDLDPGQMEHIFVCALEKRVPIAYAF